MCPVREVHFIGVKSKALRDKFMHHCFYEALAAGDGSGHHIAAGIPLFADQGGTATPD